METAAPGDRAGSSSDRCPGAGVAWVLAAWALGERGRAKEQTAVAVKLADEARQQKKCADDAAREANPRAEEARTARERADHNLAIAELRLYASKIAQAQQELKDKNNPRALQLLTPGARADATH